MRRSRAAGRSGALVEVLVDDHARESPSPPPAASYLAGRGAFVAERDHVRRLELAPADVPPNVHARAYAALDRVAERRAVDDRRRASAGCRRSEDAVDLVEQVHVRRVMRLVAALRPGADVWAAPSRVKSATYSSMISGPRLDAVATTAIRAFSPPHAATKRDSTVRFWSLSSAPPMTYSAPTRLSESGMPEPYVLRPSRCAGLAAMGKTWLMAATGYRQLIIMRHAKTEQSAGSDRARKLTSRGRADARAGGRWLGDNGLTPTLILTSPASRALATADIVAAELTGGPETRTVEDLYGASPAEAIEILASTDDGAASVLVVGHNPTMEELAYLLQREAGEPWAPHLATAGLAVLDVPGEWADLAPGSADLTHWHVPRS